MHLNAGHKGEKRDILSLSQMTNWKSLKLFHLKHFFKGFILNPLQIKKNGSSDCETKSLKKLKKINKTNRTINQFIVKQTIRNPILKKQKWLFIQHIFIKYNLLPVKVKYQIYLHHAN